MKKFKFSLQPLLKVRRSLEKQQKAELAKARQYYLECLGVLKGFENDFALANDEYKKMAQAGISADGLVSYAQYFEYLNDAIKKQTKIVEKALEEQQRQQKKLIKTMQDRKVLEKLKETKLEQHETEMRIEQEKEIGDLVSYKTIIADREAM